MSGDTSRNASEIHPLANVRDIREIVDSPEMLKGARSKVGKSLWHKKIIYKIGKLLIYAPEF